MNNRSAIMDLMRNYCHRSQFDYGLNGVGTIEIKTNEGLLSQWVDTLYCAWQRGSHQPQADTAPRPQFSHSVNIDSLVPSSSDFMDAMAMTIASARRVNGVHILVDDAVDNSGITTPTYTQGRKSAGATGITGSVVPSVPTGGSRIKPLMYKGAVKLSPPSTAPTNTAGLIKILFKKK